MFDLSWTETLLCLVVAVLVIKPEDFPVIAKNVGRCVGKIKNMASELMNAFEDEAGLEGIKSEISHEAKGLKKIVDMEGKLVDAYDLDEVRGELGINITEEPKQVKK